MPISSKTVFVLIVKILGWIVSFALVLFLLLVLIIRSEKGQQFITSKATSFVSDKTNTRIDIRRLYLTFDGNLFLEDVYLEDTKGDTLLYSQSLEVGVALVPLIKGDVINIKFIHWQGLTARVARKAPKGDFNFNFLIEAFTSPQEEAQELTPTEKEPMSTTPEIVIGEIILDNIHLAYDDELLGMSTTLALNSLNLEVQALDIEKAIYAIDELGINGLKAAYLQYAELPVSAPDTTTSDVPLPTVIVESLQLENIEVLYDSRPDSLFLNALFESLTLSLPKLELQNQSIDLETLTLEGADVQFDDFSRSVTSANTNKSTMFIWPEWTISGKKIDLINSDFRYRTKEEEPLKDIFDPAYLEIDDTYLSVRNVSYEKEKVSLELTKSSLRERSGITLHELTAQVDLDAKHIGINELRFETDHNFLKGKAQLGYKSFNGFINNPEKANFSVDIDRLALSMEDAYYFQPDLSKNDIVDILNSEKLKGSLNVSGNLSKVKLVDLNLNWGATNLAAVGEAQHLLNNERLSYNLIKFQLTSSKQDLSRFVSDMEQANYIPSSVRLEGNLRGGLQQVLGNLNLESSLGDAQLSLDIDLSDTLTYDLDLDVDELQMSELLSDPAFDPLTMHLKVNGKGQELSSINGNIDASFEKLGFRGYDFSALNFEGTIKNGEVSTLISYSDSSLNATLNASLVLDTVSPKAKIALNVIGAALEPLGLASRDIRTAFNLDADFSGNASAFDASINITDALAVYNYRSYQLGQFEGEMHVRDDSSNLRVNSEIIDVSLISNAAPQGLFSSLNDKFQSYLGGQVIQDSIKRDVNMRMDMVIRENPLLDEVFLTQLNEFDSMSFNVWYDEALDSLSAHFIAPFIDFQGNTLDSLKFDLNASDSHADFKLGWEKIIAGPVTIERTAFDGKVKNDSLFVDFLVLDKKEKLFQIKSNLTMNADTLYYHLDSEGLILNKTPWETSLQNQIAFTNQFIDFRMFYIQNNNQQIKAESTTSKNSYEEVSLLFNDFELTTFTSFFSTEVEILNGIINGDFKLIDPYGSAGLEADMKVKDFSILEKELGLLSLFGQSSSGNEYDFDLSLNDGPLVFGLAGNYSALESGPVLDLGLTLEKLEMELIQQFAEGELANARGYISGDLNLTGTLEQPKYDGSLVFNDVGARVTYLNSDFTLPTERIALDNAGVHFDKFTVVDAQKNTFRFDGDVLTENLVNPTFKLALKANNFRAVNAQKGDNEFFYGKVLLNADLTINGNLALPKIRGDFKVNEGSDLTVIVPESQLSLIEREGIVVFVNKDQPDKIITRVSDDQSTAEITGIDLYTNLIVEDNSIFRVLIDEQTGDNFEISGRGDFTVGVDPTGRTTLAGRYKVSSGHYRASLYGLVKKKFTISPESVITWSGDPMDAKLDVAAIYEVRTSAGPIMATSITSSAQSVVRRYNVQLPFQVYLNVEGQLLQPELSFEIEMDEESRGALGGEIYTRIQQINQQESELNKQVFSLLVLNRFFPASGSDGSAGGAEALARNNVSKVLSGQLNAFSEKLLGQTGFELNFGLNSYTADQSVSGASGTQLDVTASKSLFDERLVVQVGSEVGIEGSGQTGQSGAPLIGNVSVEYKLSDNGRYRLKGFRKNEFESVLDGQLIVTGIAILFNREFNKLRDLFEKAAQEVDADGEMNSESK